MKRDDAAAASTFDRRSFLTLFAAVMLPMLMAAADQSLLSTATPVIAAQLGGLRDTAWISVAYLIAVTVMVPLYGRLGDRFGRSRVLSIALVVFALGSLACALAPNMLALIGARVAQGLGGGGLMVMSQALVGEVVPPRDRPRIQGYLALNFAVSSVGGPLVGGFVVTHGDWRWLFYANLPLAAFALWRLRKLPRVIPVQHDRTASFDTAGLVLFALATIATLLWINLGGHRFEWISVPSLVLLAVRYALGRCDLRERTTAHPSCRSNCSQCGCACDLRECGVYGRCTFRAAVLPAALSATWPSGECVAGRCAARTTDNWDGSGLDADRSLGCPHAACGCVATLRAGTGSCCDRSDGNHRAERGWNCNTVRGNRHWPGYGDAERADGDSDVGGPRAPRCIRSDGVAGAVSGRGGRHCRVQWPVLRVAVRGIQRAVERCRAVCVTGSARHAANAGSPCDLAGGRRMVRIARSSGAT